MKFHRLTMLVILVGFAASFAGFLANTFPLISLFGGLIATLIFAGLLDLTMTRRDEAFQLVQELEVRNAQLDEALSRQAQTEQNLRQAQRMEAVGQLAGGIAHDFNNMLQAILSYSEFLSDGIDPDSDLQMDVAEVQKAAHRAAALTRQLLVFSRQNVAQPTLIDLSTSVRNAEHLLRSTLRENVELSCSTPEDSCFVFADIGELELMLVHLAINARDALPHGGNISVTVDTVELDDLETDIPGLSPGPFARIGVQDDGEGMTPEVAAKAFEPFFTTKETGRGTGLGLAMVYGIANRSGGSASIATADGVGTTVTVLFPLSNEVPPSSTSSKGDAPRVTTDNIATLAVSQ